MTDRRFEAAKAAMQGIIANSNVLVFDDASVAVKYADLLLSELNRTAPKGSGERPPALPPSGSGYQPIKPLDTSNPPKGAPGVPKKEYGCTPYPTH